jgi:hydroxymethylpyrimidine pyrophosphatase-like HAD family hydrolase
MQVASSELTIFFDVDDTLIMWDENCTQPFEGALKMVCPHDGMVTFHKVHERHVGFLKKQKAKGYSVIVWSASGTKWAEAVVTKLGLQDYVDFVTSKPIKWVDDLPNPEHLVGTHVYLDPEGHSL